MEVHWLRRAGGDRLIVFMLGWAADHRVVEHIVPEGYDVVAVYDYGRRLEGVSQLRSAVESYALRWLFAWSFGVWAAEQLFGGSKQAPGARENMPDCAARTSGVVPYTDGQMGAASGAVAFERAVALNGTPFPVDERYGIEPRRLIVTIRGLGSGGTVAFNKRAYGEHFERMAPMLSPRTIGENITELELLSRLAVQEYMPGIQWDKAVVGSGDLIFPPENMLRYWGSRAEELPLPHYPFADGDIITRELECR